MMPSSRKIFLIEPGQSPLYQAAAAAQGTSTSSAKIIPTGVPQHRFEQSVSPPLSGWGGPIGSPKLDARNITTTAKYSPTAAAAAAPSSLSPLGNLSSRTQIKTKHKLNNAPLKQSPLVFGSGGLNNEYGETLDKFCRRLGFIVDHTDSEGTSTDSSSNTTNIQITSSDESSSIDSTPSGRFYSFAMPIAAAAAAAAASRPPPHTLLAPYAVAAAAAGKLRTRNSFNSIDNNELDVVLRVYDLSGGRAAFWSQFLMRKSIEGVWHTAIAVYDLEFFYGGKIEYAESDLLEEATGLAPTREIFLGRTRRRRRDFKAFLEQIDTAFQPETYDLTEWNCNHFSDVCARFLLEGRGIPQEYVTFTNRIKESIIGKLVLGILRSVGEGQTPNGTSTNPYKSRIRNEDSRCIMTLSEPPSRANSKNSLSKFTPSPKANERPPKKITTYEDLMGNNSTAANNSLTEHNRSSRYYVENQRCAFHRRALSSHAESICRRKAEAAFGREVNQLSEKVFRTSWVSARGDQPVIATAAATPSNNQRGKGVLISYEQIASSGKTTAGMLPSSEKKNSCVPATYVGYALTVTPS